MYFLDGTSQVVTLLQSNVLLVWHRHYEKSDQLVLNLSGQTSIRQEEADRLHGFVTPKSLYCICNMLYNLLTVRISTKLLN